jgi:hypothetical protein
MEDEKVKSQQLTALGTALVVLGIVFGEERLVGYSFIRAGVLLSIISMIKSRKEPKKAKPLDL